jgi:hypothetical protein
MTYFISALTNDQAKLIVSESRTDSKAVADLIAAEYAKQGHHVARWIDGEDEEGNYWGQMFNNDGKRVRICIPAK